MAKLKSSIYIPNTDIQAFSHLSKEDRAEFIKFASLGLGNPFSIKIHNYLAEGNEYDNPHVEFVHYMSRPENFRFTCKWLFNINLAPFQVVILQELWNRKFPMLIASRGAGKTFILALYAVLRALFSPGSKIVIVGAAFRQSKLLFEYIDTIYRNSPILRNICGEHPKRDIDQCFFNIGESKIIAIPLGDGQKIRGLRANYIIADEFASIPKEIFEIVVKGFGSVSANPTDRADKVAEIDILRQLGEEQEALSLEESLGFGNQTIISGTAYYAFNHFYDYWKRYKKIVESKGDIRKLQEVFQGNVEEGFDYRHYSVMRIPYTILPKGFMDEASIAQSRAMVHSAIYNMEYGAIFADDSDGFFKRSLIENCVVKGDGIEIPFSGETVKFNAALTGNPSVEYVYGIDPASESDNFAIVVIEVHPTHRRIVYCWTLNKQKMREKMSGDTSRTSVGFYNYCARKIRNLLKVFPSKHIGIDSQGGGIPLMEALRNPADMMPDEKPLWPYIVDNNNPMKPDPFFWEAEKKVTDKEDGLHHIHIINFAHSEFTSQANHGLKKDFETRTTLFPAYDPVSIAEAIAQDKIVGREVDTLEDCVMEIEELKDELTQIEHSQTAAQQREKWDTPEVKKAGQKKGRLRKDRYSALVIANMIARVIATRLKGHDHTFTGGFAGQEKPRAKGQLYTGPDSIISQLPVGYRGIIRGSR